MNIIQPTAQNWAPLEVFNFEENLHEETIWAGREYAKKSRDTGQSLTYFMLMLGLHKSLAKQKQKLEWIMLDFKWSIKVQH